MIYPTFSDNYIVPTVYDDIVINYQELRMEALSLPDSQINVFVQPFQKLDKYVKRGQDISALIKRVYTETAKIISSPPDFSPDFKLTLKALLENYKSLLDYTAHYIADKCDPIPNEKHIYFPIAAAHISKDDFIKSINRSFPKLEILAPQLFEYLLTIQHFNNDDCLIELNNLTNHYKHRGLQDLEFATFHSIVAKCGTVGFRVGELGFNSIKIGNCGRLLLIDKSASAIISGPCEISITQIDTIKKIENLKLVAEQHSLLKTPDSKKSLLSLLWMFSKHIIEIVNEVCRRHSEHSMS